MTSGCNPARRGAAARKVAALRGVVCLALSLLAMPVAAQEGERSDTDPRPVSSPRVLRYTVDEGTWMSVDVSPDGRTLVFDLLGDLYTLPVEGGKATRITSGEAFDAMPRFSPDGTMITFVSDRSGASNVWVARADGSEARQLSRTTWFNYVSPTWSPDGRAILVSRNDELRSLGTFDLYLFHLDGGNGQRLTGGGSAQRRGGGGAADHFGAHFVGTHEIWYSTSGQDAQLYTLDLRTRQAVRRTSHVGGGMRPVPSPDGKWLVYGTRRGDATALRLRDLATGDERWLVPVAQRDQMSGAPTRDLLPGMAFTPDSRALIAAFGGKIWRIAVPSGEATPIPFTADVEQHIAPSTQFSYPFEDSILTVRQIRVPRLSPDGRRVAFVALDRVWVANLPRDLVPGATLEAGTPRRVSSFAESEYSPVWSPDGRTIAFVTWNDSTGGHIYRVPANGGRPERLTRTPGFYEKLTYTPDGTKLLFAYTPRAIRFEHDETSFTSPSDTDADLMWIPADGGEPTHVTRLEYLNGFFPPYYGIPHFGPDPERILVYLPDADGLYSMRMDGSDRRLELRAHQRPWYIQGQDPAIDIALSPTGRHAAILAMQNVFVATLSESNVAPTLRLMDGAANPVPVRRLTDVGGNDIGWSKNGTLLSYALGSTLFLYDVARGDSLARLAGVASKERIDLPTRVEIDMRVPKDRPTGAVVLRGARIITMRGDEVIENGDLVVRGNRIAGVGPSGTVEMPAGAEVIDVAGATIIPGHVDTHAHIGSPGWGLHRTELWQFYVNLAYGVTTVRDPQSQVSDILDYSDRVEIGEIIGPRIFSTGRGIFDNETINSLEDVRNILRRYSDHFKTETVKQYLVGDRRRRQWFAQAAHELKLTPTVEGGGDFMLNLTHVLDGYAGLEHTLPTYPLYEDVVQLVARSGITYTPALMVSYGGPSLLEYFTSRYDLRGEAKLLRFWPQSYMERRTANGRWRPDDRYAFQHFAADAARIAAAGGRVAVGSHGNLQGIGYHLEMWGLAMGGMPPHAVLRAATLVGAQAIGHGDDLGSIDVGKIADLQVLDRNPLEDIRNTNSIRFVMKNGRLYEAGTLDEVWPRRRPLSRSQWWMADERR